MSECYVRHISGQGKIYKVFGQVSTAWQVYEGEDPLILRLPKHEYLLYDQPEHWEDVTSQCELDGLRIYITDQYHLDYLDTAYVFTETKYRLRKVQIHDPKIGFWAFIVERMVPA